MFHAFILMSAKSIVFRINNPPQEVPRRQDSVDQSMLEASKMRAVGNFADV